MPQKKLASKTPPRPRNGRVLFVEVPPAIKRRLRELAFRWETTQSAIALTALEQYLASIAVMEKEEQDEKETA